MLHTRYILSPYSTHRPTPLCERLPAVPMVYGLVAKKHVMGYSATRTVKGLVWIGISPANPFQMAYMRHLP